MLLQRVIGLLFVILFTRDFFIPMTLYPIKFVKKYLALDDKTIFLGQINQNNINKFVCNKIKFHQNPSYFYLFLKLTHKNIFLHFYCLFYKNSNNFLSEFDFQNC